MNYDIEMARTHYEDVLDTEYDTWLDSLNRAERAKAWLDCMNVTGCYETALATHTDDSWNEVPF